MADLFNTITVVLDKDYRDEDAKNIITAIRLIRGVIAAGGNVSDVTEYMAQERAKRELRQKLWDVLS